MERSPERIRKILALIKVLWNKNPDLRLGQLLININGSDTDFYYKEDDLLLKELQEALKNAPHCPETGVSLERQSDTQIHPTHAKIVN